MKSNITPKQRARVAAQVKGFALTLARSLPANDAWRMAVAMAVYVSEATLGPEQTARVFREVADELERDAPTAN